MNARQRLQRLLVKEHVHLGGLAEADRAVVFALVWTGLPDGAVWSERELNGLLQQRLAGAASFLGVDHVELRRWLCDLQWLQRDDFGREYRKRPRPALREASAALADALAGTDWDAEAARLRAEARARRAAGRAAWERAQAG
jgi:hypothetical protein